MRIRLDGGRIEAWMKWNKERWEERKEKKNWWKERTEDRRWWIKNIEIRKNKKHEIMQKIWEIRES